MGLLRSVSLGLLFFAAFNQSALARNVALVIGNSAYEHVHGLTNPNADSAAVAKNLHAAGFDLVELRNDLAADAFDEAIPLDRLLTVIEPAKKLRLIILDACRDNPFAKSMIRTVGSRAIGRGLAKVEPNSPNTLIAYAAKAGSLFSQIYTGSSSTAEELPTASSKARSRGVKTRLKFFTCSPYQRN
jgi:uncharacterized caspase-like protein